ncbi:integral membrane protein [Colletotrichum plurivorum]|uniref:Integral membrane protein n=1 Tax=Colletotrichum plurivorum TaxID=2175906 RepID=A0A8H6N3I8_9PEZI|nr:integral membrane protein [Colletotrichum plurivorum]
MDDWCILVAVIFSIGTSFTVAYRTQFGMARHTWVAEEWMTVPQMKVFYSSIVLYCVALITVRMSFLFFYRRIFPSPTLRKVCMWFIVGNGLWGTASICLNLFNCAPVQGFWDFTIPSKCVPPEVVWYFVSLTMVITDFAILILPLPAIRKLNTSPGRKMVLIGCFSVGFLTCLLSLIRLSSLKTAANKTDPNWDYVDAAMWSVAECNVAVFCACIPTLGPLVTGIKRYSLDSPQSRKLQQAAMEWANRDLHPPRELGATDLESTQRSHATQASEPLTIQ